jgi:hypothetical protein
VLGEVLARTGEWAGAYIAVAIAVLLVGAAMVFAVSAGRTHTDR